MSVQCLSQRHAIVFPMPVQCLCNPFPMAVQYVAIPFQCPLQCLCNPVSMPVQCLCNRFSILFQCFFPSSGLLALTHHHAPSLRSLSGTKIDGYRSPYGRGCREERTARSPGERRRPREGGHTCPIPQGQRLGEQPHQGKKLNFDGLFLRAID